MKRVLFAIALLGLFTFTGCSLKQMTKMAKEQELTVVPNPLELHGDSVKFTMTAKLPVKMLKKGKEYIVKPFYVYSGKEIELQNITFKADDFPNQGEQQPTITKTLSFAYEPEMKNGELYVQGVARNPENNKEKTTERMKVADGIITTSQLVQDVYYPGYAPSGYNPNEELVPTMIGFFFRQGSSYLRPEEIRSERGEFLRNFIAEKNITRSVTITGTHSPEGSERANKNLSQERAQKIEEFYRRNMKRYDYKGLADSVKFILKPVVLEWEPFVAALEEYDGIPADQKSQMLSIVNGAGTFEEKEDQLQKISGYKKVFNDVYPLLRTAKAEVLTVKEKKTEAEIATLARQIAAGSISADSLSSEELGYAATLTPSVDEKEAIYKALVKKDDSYIAHNNLGAVYLQKAAQATSDAQRNQYIEQAVTQFESANQRKESAEAYTNLGVAHLMQGNRDKAYDAITKAESLSPSEELTRGLKGVKGSIEIARGNYDKAVQTLSGAEETAENLFNLGLAYLLKKDYQNALTSLNEATSKDSNMAKAYYAAAIANTRLGNTDAAVSNLEKAGKADAEYKRVALEDLEFKNIQQDEKFRNALR